MQSTKVDDPTLAEIVRRLVQTYEPERIYLFGSRARGESGPDSDYDLIVIVPDSTPAERQDVRLAYDALRGVGTSVDTLIWTRESFDRQTPVVASLPATVLREGRLLYADERAVESTTDLAKSAGAMQGHDMAAEDEKLRLAWEWMGKALVDLWTAERMSQPPELPDIVAYHCQQAMEKVLKAFLVWNDQPFRRTHELLELVQQCEPLDGAFAGLEDAARILDPYATQYRYPGKGPSPGLEQAAIALSLAHEAFAFVEERLPPRAAP